MKINNFWIRVFGFAGIIGGLVLFAGDMLYYYAPDSLDIKLNMANASDLRIKLSATTALLATWLYLLGLIPVFYAFKKSAKISKNIIIISFAGILIAYGIIHGAYLAIATSAKLSLENKIDIDAATKLAIETNQLLRLFVYPLFAILSFFFIREVWAKRTLYPRWIIIFFPLIPFLFQGIFALILSGSSRIIILGGYYNLILVVFFTASTIALWNKNFEN